MDLLEQAPANQTPMRRAACFFRQNYEKLAYYILLLWCLLPVFMSGNYVISGILGKYPSEAEISSGGFVVGYVNYELALKTYQSLFFILGGLTFVFALLCLILCRRRVFSRRSVRRMPWFYLLAAFLLWAGVCLVSGKRAISALIGSNYMRDGYVSYLVYASVFLCASMLQDERRRRTILRCFSAVICYMALIVIIQESFDIPFINYIFSSRRAAVFNQFNHFGYMLCMAEITLFGLFLYDREAKNWLRWLYLAGVIYLTFALIVNDTLGAMLAVLAAVPAVLVFYLRSGRKLKVRTVLLVLLAVLAAGLVFFVLYAGNGRLIGNFTQLRSDLVKIFTRAEDAGSAGTNRFRLWLDTLQVIRQRPILGVGPEGLNGRYALTDGLLPHNTYLQIAAYTGIVGLVLYLAALFSLAGDRWRCIRRLDPMVLTAAGGVVAYLASQFVGCPVFNTEPYFWLFLGIVTAAQHGKKPLLCPGEPDEDEEETAEPGRAAQAFSRHQEGIAYRLLQLWCLLPAVISVVYIVMGALGKFPTAEQLASAGISVGYNNYIAALRAYQTLYFILGAVTLLNALVSLLFCRRHVFSLSSVRQRPWLYLFALLLLWATASAFLSGYFYHAFVGGSYVRDGLASYFIYASVFLCALTIRREDYRRGLMRCFSAVIVYLALIMIIQESFDIPFINYVFSSRRAAVFNQLNHFGYMLCMALVCLLGLFLYDREAGTRLRALYLAGAAFLAYALIVNDTFGAILAAIFAAAAVLILYVRSGRKLNLRTLGIVLGIALALLVCAALLFPGLLHNFAQLKTDIIKIVTGAEDAGTAGTGRFLLWKETLQRIAQKPVFGYGPEGFVGRFAITDDKRPHNEYLQVAAYLGIPALLLYLAAILTLAVRQLRRVRQLEPMVLAAGGMAIAYLISAFVGNPVYNTAPYLWLFLGLAAGEETPVLCAQACGEKTGRGTARLTLLSVLICVLVCFGAWSSLQKEREAELTDLQTMLDAEIAAKEMLTPEMLGEEPAFFWYEKRGKIVYPITMTEPKPYGKGGWNNGGGRLDFYNEYGKLYSYDENENYTDKMIIIAASKDANDAINIIPFWQ